MGERQGVRVMHPLNMYEPATPHSTETEPLSVGDSGYAVCLAGVCRRVIQRRKGDEAEEGGQIE